jgi:hypothetical protein
MSEIDAILWVEAKTAMAQHYLKDGTRIRTDFFNADIQTAIHLVKLGYKLNRRKAWDKDCFFTIDISDRTTVFFQIPQ